MALVNLLNCIDPMKFDIDLLLLQKGYDYESMLPNNINVIKIDLDEAQGSIFNSVWRNIRRKDLICVSYRILNILARNISKKFFQLLPLGQFIKPKYDAVIAFRPGICADIALYKSKSGVKTCWWHHGNLEIGTPFEDIKKQLSEFDQVITVGTGIKELLSKKFNEISTKLDIIPNIDDTETITSKSIEHNPYPAFSDTNNNFTIVTVSRLSKEKNVAKAIEVADTLRRKGVKFKWHIIGDGDCKSEIIQRIKRYELESYIIMEGNQSNPYPWIKNADLMVHLSTVESFGLVILEAIVLKVPCIAVESIGAIELLGQRSNLLTKNDSNIIADKIISIINKSNKERQLIVEANNDILKKYTPQRVSEIFNHKFYDKTDL